MQSPVSDRPATPDSGTGGDERGAVVADPAAASTPQSSSTSSSPSDPSPTGSFLADVRAKLPTTALITGAIAGGGLVLQASSRAGSANLYLLGLLVCAVTVVAAAARVAVPHRWWRGLGAVALVVVAVVAAAWIVPGRNLPADASGAVPSLTVTGRVSGVEPLGDGRFVVQTTLGEGTVYGPDLAVVSQWRLENDERLGIGADDVVYRVGLDGAVEAFDSAGTSLWQTQLELDGDEPGRFHPLAGPVDGGVVVVARLGFGGPATLISLDATGAERWRTTLEETQSPVVRGVSRGIVRLPSVIVSRQWDPGAGGRPRLGIVDVDDGELVQPSFRARVSDVIIGSGVVADVWTFGTQCGVDFYDAHGERTSTTTASCDGGPVTFVDSQDRIYLQGQSSTTVVSPGTGVAERFPAALIGTTLDGALRVTTDEGVSGVHLVDSDRVYAVDGWRATNGAWGTLVSTHERTSRNPRRPAGTTIVDVALIDAATATECARTDIGAELSELVLYTLPGCRAVIVVPSAPGAVYVVAASDAPAA